MKRTVRILSLVLALLLAVNLLGTAPVKVSAETDPFKSASVTLDSALKVNFTATVTDTENAVMTFEIAGKTQTVSVKDAEKKGNNLYTFSCSIAAVQMTDTVKATLQDGNNTYTKTTTVRDYAAALLASDQWDKLAANEIMLATLHYGGALQTYAKYNTGNMANKDYTAPAAPQDIYVPEAPMVTGSVSGITGLSATLILKSNVNVRFYVRLTGNLSDYTFKIGDQTVELKPVEDRYYVDYNDINPQEYKDDITLTITKDGQTMTVNYSPVRYIYTMYNKGATEESLKTLLGRLYQYHEAAAVYVTNRLGNEYDNIVSAQ